MIPNTKKENTDSIVVLLSKTWVWVTFHIWHVKLGNDLSARNWNWIWPIRSLTLYIPKILHQLYFSEVFPLFLNLILVHFLFIFRLFLVFRNENLFQNYFDINLERIDWVDPILGPCLDIWPWQHGFDSWMGRTFFSNAFVYLKAEISLQGAKVPAQTPF